MNFFQLLSMYTYIFFYKNIPRGKMHIVKEQNFPQVRLHGGLAQL